MGYTMSISQETTIHCKITGLLSGISDGKLKGIHLTIRIEKNIQQLNRSVSVITTLMLAPFWSQVSIFTYSCFYKIS